MRIDVQGILGRLHKLEEDLGKESVLNDREKFKSFSQEHSYLSEILRICERQSNVSRQLQENEDLLKSESDPEFQQVIRDEQALLHKQLESLEKELADLLVPPDEGDDRTAIMELRAGAGGQEAGLFVADCVRMYELYANKMKWKVEGLSATPSDLGGFKEYIMAISGKGAWRFLRHEGGTHRVQRVPETEAQGRIHTSTITVAVLQEVDEASGAITIPEQELRIETTRSSGAGGQHVNKTDSAVRITHIPSGLVVFCQEERSQHKNKDKAMRLLRAKLREMQERQKKSEQDALRLEQVGSGDRSEKIRTYNFHQNRVTDHRIELTRYDLDRVMNGDLEEFSRQLVSWSYKNAVTCPWILSP